MYSNLQQSNEHVHVFQSWQIDKLTALDRFKSEVDDSLYLSINYFNFMYYRLLNGYGQDIWNNKKVISINRIPGQLLRMCEPAR
jgi:hypothetical protein